MRVVGALGVLALSTALSQVLAQADPSDRTPVGEGARVVAAWLDARAGLPPLYVLDSLLPPFRAGWVNDAELRTETDEFDPGRQRYAARIQPKSPRVRRAEEALQRVQRERLGEEPADLAARLRAEAWDLLAEAVADARLRAATDSLLALRRRLARLSETALADPDAGVDDWLRAAEAVEDLELDRARLIATEPPPLPPDRFVDVPAIRARLAVLTAAEPALAVDGELAELAAERELELAEARRWIDFVQVDYRSGQDLPAETWSVTASVDLPRRRSRIRALDELRVETLAAEQERLARRLRRDRAFAAAAAELSTDLEALARKRAVVAERERRRERLRAALRQNAATDPARLLRLRAADADGRLDLAEDAARVFRDYARLVAELGLTDAAEAAAWLLR